MAADLSGVWKLVNTDDNFDAFLKACGVSWPWRKAASAAKPSVIITQEGGGKFTIVTKNKYKTHEMRFLLSQEFVGVLPWETREQRMIAEWDGAKLVIQLLEQDIVFVREVVDGEMVLTQTKGELSTKRRFKKSESSE